MHRFFIEELQIADGRVWIGGSDVNHIRNVLRMRPGDELVVVTGTDREYVCELAGYEDGRVSALVREERIADTELASRIVLFQGLPKGDKMDLIVQKAVELGASAVVPVAMERSVVRLDAGKAARRAERWQAIAEGAAKQSRRMRVPEVSLPMSFREALEAARDLDVRLIPYELAEGMGRTREILSGIRPGQSVAVFIGPEGGISQTELAEALAAGAQPVTLGRRILRTETAGPAVLSMLVYLLEDAAHE